MWFLYVLSWFALLIQISVITIAVDICNSQMYIRVIFCLAAGLYYLAELVEEYTVMTQKVIYFMTLATLFIYVGFFLFEDFPTSLIAGGLISNISHLFILKTFPLVAVTSPSFIIAVVMLLVNHYMAFYYFSSVYYPFSEIIAYFTLCLWLIPFALFVSLSANENVLPTLAEKRPLLDDNDVVSNYFSRKKKYGLLSFFNYAKDSVLPQRTKKAF